MKNIIVSILLLLMFKLIYGQEPPSDYKNFIEKADSLYKLKEYKKSAENYSLAFKSCAWKGAPKDRYNAARSWTLANVADSAFDCLDRIVNKLGYSKYEDIVAEEDFNLLHSDNRWEPLLDRVKRNKLPTGWFRGGTELTSYQMLIDSSSGQDGKNVLTIKSMEEKIDGFGTLMQNFFPNEYLGKRIRLTGYMKSNAVKGWAGFWLRVDQTASKKSLAFDNMQDRAIKGTTEWNKYEIVLEVPNNASNIAFGALLKGVGQIWFEKLDIEVVSKSVPLTGRKKTEPNLDFEK